ncbi:MAG: filamentous hemagglutinin N-terminal domain-containing protein [Candidatus Eremiobacteraeota bacterium]|nr:filamentous hemagglutinin N-terminal domain-containing protein [Candidatus Eremiobacteraeota bacterium]MCW5866957.1 filamentous hemagglutinin N-terminal domain-containing protein [Candidatus Eremiobacteraeota bacterium]
MMYKRKNPRTLLASLTMAAALYGTSLALPTDGQVTNGQVNIGNPVNGQMTIQQLSDRAIINWNGFSINANEALRFIQPSQLSAILNRVTGQDPSVILGSLQANGRVFLINPNGILFGAGSQVNVGSLMASTLDITDQNFLAGRYKFDQVEGKPAASIVNEGTLTVTPGGFLVLTSPLISNQGVIVANVGQIALAAGEHTEINFDGQGLINIQVDPAASQAGPVAISHGMLDHMVGSLLNLAPADAITQLPDGGVEIAGASGRLHNTGEIHADALPGQAAGRVMLNSQQSTLVRSGSLITANGSGEGSNGGDVYLLSNGLAALEQGANVQALGGSTGNGGFVELSGKGRVWVEGGVDVRAIQGTAGVFLIDPADLTIINDTNGNGSLDGFANTQGQDIPPNTVSNGFINAFNSGTLILQADNSITQLAGADINMNLGANDLVLTTNTGDINLNGNINTNAGRLTVTAGGRIGLAGTSYASATEIVMTAGPGSSIGNAGSTALLSAPSITLTAPGGIFGSTVTPPNIASGSPLRTDATSNLNLNAGPTGNIFVLNQGSTVVNATGGGVAIGLATPGTIVVGDDGIAGTILGTAVNATDIHATGTSGVLGSPTSPTQLVTTDAIGTTAQAVRTAGSTLNLSAAGTGGINITNTGVSTVNLNVPNGPISIASDSNINIGNSTFFDPLAGTFVTASTSAANPFTLTTTGAVAYADAGASHPTLTGSSVNITANNGIGTNGAIETGTTLLNLAASNGGIRATNNQGASVNATAGNGAATVTTNGNLVVGTSGIRGTTGTNVTATGGSLTGSGTVGNGGTTTINAASVGTAGTPLQTAGSVLNVTASSGSADLEQSGSASVNVTSPATVNLTATSGSLTVGSAGVVGQTGTTVTVNGGGDLLSGGTGGRVGSSGTTTSIQAANIGASGARVGTAGSTVNLNAGTVRVDNNGTSTFSVNPAATVVDILSNGDIDLAVGFATNPTTLSLVTTGGTITFDTTPFPLVGNTVTLSTSTSLGSSGTPLQTDADTLTASSTGGSVFINNNGALVAGGQASQDYVLTATGPVTLSTISAGGIATINSQGSILGNGAATNVQASTVNLNVTGGTGSIGSSPASRLNTQANTLNATGPDGVFIQQNGATTATATATNGDVDLNVNGNLNLQLISASGNVKLQTCPEGSILDANGAADNIQAGGDVTLIAHGTIGTDTDAIEVDVAAGLLRVAAGGAVNGVAINVDGTTSDNSMEVFDPPAGTACFTGLPTGRALFNGTIVFEPSAPAPTPNNNFVFIGGGQAANLRPSEVRNAIDASLLNPFIFNVPPILDDKGRVAGSAFTPFYTAGLAFLLDKEDWLRFLQETVVWDIDEEEAKDL